MSIKKHSYGLRISFELFVDDSIVDEIHQTVIESESVDLIKRDYHRLKNFCSDYTDMLGKFFPDDYVNVCEWFHRDDEFDKCLEDLHK